jgi:hypothetical protein
MSKKELGTVPVFQTTNQSHRTDFGRVILNNV